MGIEKRPLAFLLAVTGNIAFAAGNVALSIYRHATSADYDIVVYHRYVSDHDLAVLSLIPHVILRPFSLSDDMVELFLAKLPSSSRFKNRNGLMSFAHFEVFDLLKDYKAVAWIDVDTAIQRDICGIVSYIPFGMTIDEPWLVGDNFSEPVSGFDMQSPSYCAAVMVSDDTLPYRDIHSWLYARAIEFSGVLKNLDQAIINIALQEFNISPTLMPLGEWQCVPWRREAHDARIVHFATERKIWKSQLMCSAFPEWYRTHLRWLDVGGSDFSRDEFHVVNLLQEIERAQSFGLEDLGFGVLAEAAWRKLSRKLRGGDHDRAA